MSPPLGRRSADCRLLDGGQAAPVRTLRRSFEPEIRQCAPVRVLPGWAVCGLAWRSVWAVLGAGYVGGWAFVWDSATRSSGLACRGGDRGNDGRPTAHCVPNGAL
jgi:hypothetical protein